VSDDSIPPLEKAAQDPDRRVTFSGLTPGRLYNVSVWTVSGGVASAPIVRQERLHPQPVADINATQIRDKQIALAWTQPNGDLDAFEVQYLDTHDRVVANTTATNSIVITGLRPFHNYTFTVITISGNTQVCQAEIRLR
jgi:cadherin 5 type 2 (VE-cadherin)